MNQSLVALSTVLFVSTVAAVGVGGCYEAPAATGSSSGNVAGPYGQAGGGVGGAVAEGLPCEVQALLVERCVSCHGAEHPRTPMALVTYDDLNARSKSDPTKTVTALALERIRSDASPMPPSGPRVAQPQEAAFAAWVERGAPRESCASAPAPGSPSSPISPQSEPTPVGNPVTACGSLDNAEWQNIYTTFVGPGTPGHCGNSGCHSGTNGGWSVGSNPTASSFLSAWIQRGLISPANPNASLIASASSPVVWFNAGGSMPEDNQTANSQAASAIRSWLAAAGACDSGAPAATPSGGSAICAPGTVAMTVSVTAADPGDYVEIRPSRSTVYAGSTLTECVTVGAALELRSTGTTTWAGTSCGPSSRCNLSANALTIAANIN